MKLDSCVYDFYESMVNVFEENMHNIFGENVKKTEVNCTFEWMGNFQLKYDYLPNNYQIVIENELRTFTIGIYDSSKAWTSLHRISRFNSELNAANIESALYLLKEVLEVNDFNLYFCKGNKLYRKNKDGIKRIKDISKYYRGEA